MVQLLNAVRHRGFAVDDEIDYLLLNKSRFGLLGHGLFMVIDRFILG